MHNHTQIRAVVRAMPVGFGHWLTFRMIERLLGIISLLRTDSASDFW